MTEHIIELTNSKYREKIEQHLSKYTDISMPVWMISYYTLMQTPRHSKRSNLINYPARSQPTI
jgi:hypothetical protein